MQATLTSTTQSHKSFLCVELSIASFTLRLLRITRYETVTTPESSPRCARSNVTGTIPAVDQMPQPADTSPPCLRGDSQTDRFVRQFVGDVSTVRAAMCRSVQT